MRKTAIVLHFFVGVGAMAGGLGAILSPEGPMGMSVEVLKYSSLTSFLIPGILLFTIVGVFNILAGVLEIIRVKGNEYFIGIMGIFLTAWIFVQCLFMLSIHFLHVTYLIIGVMQIFISLRLLITKKMIPWMD